MKQRREIRERIAQRKAWEVQLRRATEDKTISMTDYAFITGTALSQVRNEIREGMLPIRMVGKRRFIRLTPEVGVKLVAGSKRLREKEFF